MPSPFNLNALKGRLAEQLVQDLFINSGYNVFSYGLEKLHPGLSRLIKNNQQRTSRALRFMPDFVVQSSTNGELFYLEVKFRADGVFAFDERYQDYPYQNAWFVIVSPKGIRCIHYRQLAKGLVLTDHPRWELLKVKSFHLDPSLLAEYEAYAILLFGAFKK
jgi:hypothetical protein